MSEDDIINPNEEAARDPRIDTQRQNRAPDALSGTQGSENRAPDSFEEGGRRYGRAPDSLSDTDRTQPVDSDEVYTQDESGALDRPPNQATEQNPTGDAHFYEMSPTSTSGATAMQEAEEDFENDED